MKGFLAVSSKAVCSLTGFLGCAQSSTAVRGRGESHPDADPGDRPTPAPAPHGQAPPDVCCCGPHAAADQQLCSVRAPLRVFMS